MILIGSTNEFKCFNTEDTESTEEMQNTAVSDQPSAISQKLSCVETYETYLYCLFSVSSVLSVLNVFDLNKE
jgi:hypothetical protein